MARGAFDTVERDGITYCYDQPRRSVYVKGFAFGRFLLVLVGLEAFAVLMIADALSFGNAVAIDLLYMIACIFPAFRLARLRVFDAPWWGGLGHTARGYGLMAGAIVVMQWLAHALDGVLLLGFLMRWAFYLGSLGILGTMVFRGAASIAVEAGEEIKALPRVVTPLDLSKRYARMQADGDRLAALAVFDAGEPALVAAWQGKRTDAIEQRLRAGDGLNRESWQQAIARFNAATTDIDLARGRLRQVVQEADAALAAYRIDCDAIVIDRSGVLHGRMREARLPPQNLPQKLNYAQGASMAVSKAAGGSMPWQFAAAAVVFSGVMMAVNHQTLLRQLKELEGQVLAQAQAVRGDIGLIGDEMRLRMVPQFEGLMRLTAQLEDGLRGLRLAEGDAATDTAPSRAFELACVFREARYYLEMKAGD